MKNIYIAIIALLCAATGSAADFNTYFADSTLRVDYVLGADHGLRTALPHGMTKFAGWAGRRHNLDKLHLRGNGRLTLRHAATDSVIYRTSFSTLFHEWVAMPETASEAKAFQHSVLAPLPLDSARIELLLFDAHQDTMLCVSQMYRPSDVLVRNLPPSTTPYRYLNRANPDSTSINIAILAEGYTLADMDSFYTHAARTAEAILGYEPFSRYASRINIVALATPSAHSGVSVPRLGQWRSTAFDSHFSTFYSDRYLTLPSVWKLHDAAAAVPYEHLIVLANTDEYGGGGIYNSYTLTTTGHANFKPVVVHEFGHSFGGLADEYYYDDDCMLDTYALDIEPWEPNITTLVDFPSKWQRLLAPGTPIPTRKVDFSKYPVGVYEGGGYSAKGIYRPAFDCRMRTNVAPRFCPACTDALERLILYYLN